MCERRVTPFFKTIAGVAEFIEYDDESRYLFSTEFEGIGHDIRNGHYDLCVMLEPSPDLPLLYIAGQSAAAVRVGFAGAGDYPFLNLHVNPSQGTTNLSDRSAVVASVLGMPARARTQWSVAKEAVDEMGHLLREMGVDPASRLIGVDGEYFFRHFGKQWTQSLLDMLKTKQHVCYFYAFGLPEQEATAWMEQQGLPLFSSIPVPRSAALVDRSEFIVAGPGVLFELADLLKTPVAGVFTSEEFDMLCRESDTTKGLRLTSRPDDATIASVERIVDSRLSSR
jgi:ADP-heptose:LPS heptosyltransferase